MYQLNQSYRQVFVLPGNGILAQGTTVDLALGQIGFFDGETYAATKNPTYAKNKALIVAQGRPDLSALGGAANLHVHGHSDKSKLIKGKNILEWRGSKAKRGQNEVVAIGYDGVNDCKTLSAKCGEPLTVYIRLTGAPMTKWFSTQGIIRQYTINTKCSCCNTCCDSTCDTCESVCPIDLANELAAAINNDRVMYKTNLSQFVKAEVVKKCTLAQTLLTGISYTRYELEVCDNGGAYMLAQLQAQNPGLNVSRIKRNGNTSIYELWKQTSLGALADAVIKHNFIADCQECPCGFTIENGSRYFEVTRQDNGADLSTTIKTAYSATDAYKINENYGEGVYIIKVADGVNVTPLATDGLRAISESRDVCVAPDTTIAWCAMEVGHRYSKSYELTVGNSCGTDRLSEIVAAYPYLIITKKPLPAGTTDCANVYQTTVLSNIVKESCNTQEAIEFHLPVPFESFLWTEPNCGESTLTDCTGCVAGVILTGAFVDRETSECIWQPWMACKEYDGIHIEASCADYNYNSDPCITCELLVTKLQQFEYPQGTGCLVRKWEIDSQMYELRFWNGDKQIMDAEKYVLFSELNKFYDQYDLVFEFKYNVLGWSEKYTDTYALTFFVEEGGGKELEAIVNGYLASANINIDLIIL